MHHAADHVRELGDRHILTGADVDVHRLVIVLHQEHARIGQVVDVEEFPSRLARSPNRDFLPALFTRIVELANHRRQHVRAGEVEVVVGAVKIRRHRRNEIAPVLLAV